MPYLLNLVYCVIAITLIPVWLWRIFVGRFDTGGLWSRFRGDAPAADAEQPLIWIHGASVGELLSLQPLIARLQQPNSQQSFVISAYTRDGFRIARQTWPDARVFYLPFDFSWSVRRAMRTLSPRLLVLSELELWPNLLLQAKRRGVPVAVVSSRMNDVEFATYQRLNRLFQPALPAIRWWGAQTAEDAQRIRRLNGTDQTIIDVTGSLKFDIEPVERTRQKAGELRDRLGFRDGDLILMAGSTHAPEERMLITAFDELRAEFPRLHLVIAPRHPRRTAEVTAITRSARLSAVRLSDIRRPRTDAASVTVMDVIGLLSSGWLLADVAFVGGSLVEGCGGQNMIEPALSKIPVCFGPHVRNFQQAADGLREAGGAREVHSSADIVNVVTDWLRHPDAAEEAGLAAHAFASSCQGASTATAQALGRLL